MRCDDCSSETISTIETNTVTTRRAVDLNLTCVWLETLGWILGGDTALDGETTSGDAILGKAKLCEGRTSCDLDLGCDDINTGDFLGDGVLDLAVA
jgi:hypothetical protein